MTSQSESSFSLQGSQRRQFVRAYVDQGAPSHEDRPAARVHVVLMVTVGLMVVSVLVGVVLQLVRPVTLTGSATPVAVSTTLPSTWTAVSGWDCATNADRGFDAAGRTTAWYTVPSGAWSQDGCHGTFEAIPLSGSVHSFDQTQSAVWWFAPAEQMTRCDLAAYLPLSDNTPDVGAKAAQYSVLSGRSGSAIASLVLDQTRGRGTWQLLGTFPIRQNGIAVQLVNAGVPASARARLAVAQVRAVCTGAQ